MCKVWMPDKKLNKRKNPEINGIELAFDRDR